MAEILDRAHFTVMTGADTALQAEIVGLFRTQAAQMTQILTPETPADSLRLSVHTLKGSARGIGLFALADACEQAEAATSGPAGALSERLAAVRAALASALTALAAQGFSAPAT